MPMADLYAYLLERKLMTPIFFKPREGPSSPSFDSSKKCEHHFRAERHTLEECYHLSDCVQDLIDNKLIQFDNAIAPNIITNPLPPHQEGNVNAIITVEERVPDFSSSSFPWKDIGDRHALFDCKVLQSQVQSLADRGIIWIEREIMRRVVGPASSSIEEETAIVLTIRGFDPLILPKPASGISMISSSKALKAILPNSHRVPWKYDVYLISTRSGKEEVYSNISTSLFGLTRSGRCYTPEELEKRRKEIGKGTAKPVRNRVTTEEAEEFLKIIRNSEYSVIQQLNKSQAQISILVLLQSFNVHHKALLKVLKETCVPTGVTESSFEGMVSTVFATNQISFTDDELPPKAWPSTTLMAAKEKLKFGYQLGQGFCVIGHGKATLIELPDNKGGLGLGYNPFDEELFQASRGKKRKCIGQGMPIPHIKVTFSAPTEVIRSETAQESCDEESDLACLIGLCPEEFLVNAIISPGDDLTSTIRPRVPGETVGHWTIEPYFVVAPAE
ncbi:hypothetical protein SO802_017537 [Lithocarpus litseifolius]|uniref:Uncharacterized protein n=1 Tax=Lithocarpus litseifolius TaxID=425828 RepID=A0AAW2CL47_9ROSI